MNNYYRYPVYNIFECLILLTLKYQNNNITLDIINSLLNILTKIKNNKQLTKEIIDEYKSIIERLFYLYNKFKLKDYNIILQFLIPYNNSINSCIKNDKYPCDNILYNKVFQEKLYIYDVEDNESKEKEKEKEPVVDIKKDVIIANKDNINQIQKLKTKVNNIETNNDIISNGKEILIEILNKLLKIVTSDEEKSLLSNIKNINNRVEKFMKYISDKESLLSSSILEVTNVSSKLSQLQSKINELSEQYNKANTLMVNKDKIEEIKNFIQNININDIETKVKNINTINDQIQDINISDLNKNIDDAKNKINNLLTNEETGVDALNNKLKYYKSLLDKLTNIQELLSNQNLDTLKSNYNFINDFLPKVLDIDLEDLNTKLKNINTINDRVTKININVIENIIKSINIFEKRIKEINIDDAEKKINTLFNDNEFGFNALSNKLKKLKELNNEINTLQALINEQNVQEIQNKIQYINEKEKEIKKINTNELKDKVKNLLEDNEYGVYKITGELQKYKELIQELGSISEDDINKLKSNISIIKELDIKVDFINKLTGDIDNEKLIKIKEILSEQKYNKLLDNINTINENTSTIEKKLDEIDSSKNKINDLIGNITKKDDSITKILDEGNQAVDAIKKINIDTIINEKLNNNISDITNNVHTKLQNDKIFIKNIIDTSEIKQYINNQIQDNVNTIITNNNTLLQGLHNDYESIKSQSNQLDAKIKSLETKTNEIKNHIEKYEYEVNNDLNKSLTDQRKEVNNLRSTLSNLDNDINILDNKYRTLNNVAIETLNATLARSDEMLNELEQRINIFMHENQIEAGLNKIINNVIDKISNNEDKVLNNIKNYKDVDTKLYNLYVYTNDKISKILEEILLQKNNIDLKNNENINNILKHILNNLMFINKFLSEQFNTGSITSHISFLLNTVSGIAEALNAINYKIKADNNEYKFNIIDTSNIKNLKYKNISEKELNQLKNYDKINREQIDELNKFNDINLNNFKDLKLNKLNSINNLKNSKLNELTFPSKNRLNGLKNFEYNINDNNLVKASGNNNIKCIEDIEHKCLQYMYVDVTDKDYRYYKFIIYNIKIIDGNYQNLLLQFLKLYLKRYILIYDLKILNDTIDNIQIKQYFINKLYKNEYKLREIKQLINLSCGYKMTTYNILNVSIGMVYDYIYNSTNINNTCPLYNIDYLSLDSNSRQLFLETLMNKLDTICINV